MIDADVLIWVLRRNQSTLDWLEALAGQGGLACSVLTVSEILRAAKEQELSRTHGVLQALDIVSVTYEDAILAPLTLCANGAPGSWIRTSQRRPSVCKPTS